MKLQALTVLFLCLVVVYPVGADTKDPKLLSLDQAVSNYHRVSAEYIKSILELLMELRAAETRLTPKALAELKKLSSEIDDFEKATDRAVDRFKSDIAELIEINGEPSPVQ